jgi:glycosyltransferase involved in cell wall biosynthesis
VVTELTGLLVPTRSPQALAAAMERFIGDREWARRLGNAGRQRALLLYDENKVVALQLERIALAARQRGLL